MHGNNQKDGMSGNNHRNYPCQHCNTDMTRFMRYCPGCGDPQLWSAEYIRSDSNEHTGEYDGWAISSRFAYSPWTGGEFDAELPPVKRAAGFLLNLHCPNECGGFVERYMNFCPSCGEGDPPGLLDVTKRFLGFEATWFIWNRETNPGKQYLAGALLNTDCDFCGWEVSEKWTYCPWCALERLVLPFRLQEAVDHIREKLTDEKDLSLLKTIVGHAISNWNDNDFSDTVHHARTFLENWLRYLAESIGMDAHARDGAGKIAYLLKNQLGPEHEELFEYAGYVISIGNEGAHRRRRISEASAVKALESLNLFLERAIDIE